MRRDRWYARGELASKVAGVVVGKPVKFAYNHVAKPVGKATGEAIVGAAKYVGVKGAAGGVSGYAITGGPIGIIAGAVLGKNVRGIYNGAKGIAEAVVDARQYEDIDEDARHTSVEAAYNWPTFSEHHYNTPQYDEPSVIKEPAAVGKPKYGAPRKRKNESDDAFNARKAEAQVRNGEKRAAYENYRVAKDAYDAAVRNLGGADKVSKENRRRIFACRKKNLGKRVIYGAENLGKRIVYGLGDSLKGIGYTAGNAVKASAYAAGNTINWAAKTAENSGKMRRLEEKVSEVFEEEGKTVTPRSIFEKERDTKKKNELIKKFNKVRQKIFKVRMEVMYGRREANQRTIDYYNDLVREQMDIGLELEEADPSQYYAPFKDRDAA